MKTTQNGLQIFDSNAIQKLIQKQPEFADNLKSASGGESEAAKVEKAVNALNEKNYEAQREAMSLTAKKIDDLTLSVIKGFDRVGGGAKELLNYTNPSATGDAVAKSLKSYNSIMGNSAANVVDKGTAALGYAEQLNKLAGSGGTLTTKGSVFQAVEAGYEKSLRTNLDQYRAEAQKSGNMEDYIALVKKLMQDTGTTSVEAALRSIAFTGSVGITGAKDLTGESKIHADQAYQGQIENFAKQAKQSGQTDSWITQMTSLVNSERSGPSKDPTVNAINVAASSQLSVANKSFDMLGNILRVLEHKPSITVSGPGGHAAGYVPGYAGGNAEEAVAKSLGAKSPRAMYGRGTIGGKKFIMNSEEMEIPRFGANGDSAVIPMYAGGNDPTEPIPNKIDLNSTTGKTSWGTYYDTTKTGLGKSNGRFTGLNFFRKEMMDLGQHEPYTKNIFINKSLLSLGSDMGNFFNIGGTDYSLSEIRRFVIAHESHHASGNWRQHPILEELYRSSETVANFKGGFAAKRDANIIQRIGGGYNAVKNYLNNPKALDEYLVAKSDRFSAARNHLMRMQNPILSKEYTFEKTPILGGDKGEFTYLWKKWQDFNLGKKLEWTVNSEDARLPLGAINRDARVVTDLQKSMGKLLSGETSTQFLRGAMSNAGLAAKGLAGSALRAAGGALRLGGSVPAQILGGAESMGDATIEGAERREKEIQEKASNDAMVRKILGRVPQSSVYAKPSFGLNGYAQGYIPDQKTVLDEIQQTIDKARRNSATIRPPQDFTNASGPYPNVLTDASRGNTYSNMWEQLTGERQDPDLNKWMLGRTPPTSPMQMLRYHERLQDENAKADALKFKEESIIYPHVKPNHLNSQDFKWSPLHGGMHKSGNIGHPRRGSRQDWGLSNYNPGDFSTTKDSRFKKEFEAHGDQIDYYNYHKYDPIEVDTNRIDYYNQHKYDHITREKNPWAIENDEIIKFNAEQAYKTRVEESLRKKKAFEAAEQFNSSRGYAEGNMPGGANLDLDFNFNIGKGGNESDHSKFVEMLHSAVHEVVNKHYGAELDTARNIGIQNPSLLGPSRGIDRYQRPVI